MISFTHHFKSIIMKENGMGKIPRYRQLYELLRKHILEGVYQEGDLLPSENELCVLHELTRPTVRHALDTLVYEGYIRKHRGKGSIVNQLPRGIGILSIKGTTQVIGEDNLKTRILVKPSIKQWDEPFFYDLTEEEAESGCIYMERLRYVDYKAIFYDINYIPNINLPRFTSRSFDNKSLFDTLRLTYNIEIKGGDQKLRAIRADSRLGRFFNVAKGHPVLHLERRMKTNREGFHIYSSFYCNTQSHSLYGEF